MISRAALKTLSRGASRHAIVTLEPEVLDLDALQDAAPCPPRWRPATLSPRTGRTLREAVDACQRQNIQTALEQHQGHWANAARQLGLDASNL